MGLTQNRWFKGLAMAALAVAAFLVVAGAAGSRPTGGGTVPGRADLAGLRDVVVPVLRTVYLVALVMALFHWLVGSDKMTGEASGRRLSPIATLLALLVVAVVSYFVMTFDGGFLGGGDLLPDPDELPPAAEGGGLQGGGIGLDDWLAGESPAPADAVLTNRWVLVAVVAVGGGLAAFALLRRQPDIDEFETAGPAPVPPGQPESSTPVPTDPKWRVFAAYGRVERASTTRGRGRLAGETVAGHVRRLSGGPAARTLVSLYNQARFSTRPVDEQEAAEAERAGIALTEELQ